MTTEPLPTTPYIGRCPAKGCKVARRIDVERRGTRADRYGHVSRFVTSGSLINAVHAANHSCPEHGALQWTWKPVKGTYSAAHECDARCLAAIGPNCECSCGGANHGANHA